MIFILILSVIYIIIDITNQTGVQFSQGVHTNFNNNQINRNNESILLYSIEKLGSKVVIPLLHERSNGPFTIKLWAESVEESLFVRFLEF